MNILIDIGHPAHVHYFRNFIKIMETKDHRFHIIARDKEVTFNLLKAFDIPYISRGKGGKGFWGKLMYMFKGDYIIYKEAKKFKPDIFLSFASVYAAQVSKILRKPHIAFNDTEHALLGHLLYFPFTDVVLTPNSFYKKLGTKQIKFKGFMELCYLHPRYFNPKLDILSELGIGQQEKFTLLRFVSWEVSHDFGKARLNTEFKIKLFNDLHKYSKVLISAEGELPSELEKYRVRISPEKMHDVLSCASLYIGEGATTASECAILGTPAIYVNILDAGTLQEQEKFGLLLNFRNDIGVIEKAIELINTSKIDEEWKKRRMKMLKEKIDVTAFMIWFVENYPESFRVMKENLNYQDRFK